MAIKSDLSRQNRNGALVLKHALETGSINKGYPQQHTPQDNRAVQRKTFI